MKFNWVLKEVVWCLLIEGRISYDRIRRDFGLDDAGLEDLRHVLIQAKGCALDQDGQFLLWAPAASSNVVQLRAELPALRVIKGDCQRPPAPEPAPAPVAATAPASPAAEPTGAERRQLTVMFCDVVGSTDLSTRLDPEDLADVIRAYQTAVTPVIRRFDGFIAKFMGDGILVYFGYPLAHEKDAERAVRTGLAILEAIPALNAEMGRAKGVSLAVRIGIATGVVMVGESVGQGAAAEKAVVGETPNLAARLQALAGPNGLVIAAATRALTGEAFVYQALGSHELKGIAEPVYAWAVTGLAATECEQETVTVTALPLLVGRDEEIGLLRRAWAQARDERRGQVVLVSGEPGIGKSTLIRTLRAGVQAEGLPRMTFSCSPYYTNSALHPIVERLKRAAGWQPEDEAAARLDKLEAMLAGYSLPLVESVPLIAALLSLPVPEERWPPLRLTPQQLKQQTEDALIAFTLEEAERRPVLEVWEDLHWADPSTLEVLGQLIEQSRTASLLLVLTFRPEFSPPWPARHLTPITAGPAGAAADRGHGAAACRGQGVAARGAGLHRAQD